MEDLKTMMDSLPIVDVNKNVHQFIHSADEYENRLKKVFVLLSLISEAAKMIKAVGTDDFISDICESINKLEQDAKKLEAEYRAQLMQNDEVLQILTNSSDNQVEKIKREISNLLSEYDSIIKNMVERREKMTIEEQITVENNNATNA